MDSDKGLVTVDEVPVGRADMRRLADLARARLDEIFVAYFNEDNPTGDVSSQSVLVSAPSEEILGLLETYRNFQPKADRSDYDARELVDMRNQALMRDNVVRVIQSAMRSRQPAQSLTLQDSVGKVGEKTQAHHARPQEHLCVRVATAIGECLHKVDLALSEPIGEEFF